jgi:DMSO reductase family type II enzyme heme b subunit
MKDLYPNMHIDNYPLEFSDAGKLKGLNDANREVFATGLAAGNPQSYQKVKGFDEIVAEGFGSSSVIENIEGLADGKWSDGEWTVVIARPLKRLKGSVLEAGSSSFTAFAVWQGGEDEVGSRKSVTMNWVPLQLAALPGEKALVSRNGK